MCCNKIFGIRHLQALLLFFAMVLSFAMRVNISMAIVAMTDRRIEDSFDWDMQIQSVVSSSFFWGYIVLQVPSGLLAARYGGMIFITTAIAVNSVLSMLIPFGAHNWGWKGLCVLRGIQGLSQGCLFPTMHHLIGKWVPLEEKGRLGTLIYGGSLLGTGMELIASGYIADYWGWPAIFYVNGIIAAIWVMFYVFLGADSPQKSRIISLEERHFIQTSLGQTDEEKILKTPWKKLATSVPFMSLIVVHSGHNWGFWTLMTEMPSYMRLVLNVDIKSNGVMSAVPYFVMYILSFPCGFISDYGLKNNWFSINTCRKVSNSIGAFGPALALIALCHSPPGDVTRAVSLLTLVVGLNAGHLSGFMLVHIDMAPNFAGIMMGITTFFANVVSIIAPLFAGHILQNEYDGDEWRLVFYVTSGVYIVTNTVFIIFGTSARQPWNDPDYSDSNPGKDEFIVSSLNIYS